MGEGRVPTREQLQAWREEHVTEQQAPGGGLPFSLDDDIHQAKVARKRGWPLGGGRTDLPPEYWKALGRFIDREE